VPSPELEQAIVTLEAKAVARDGEDLYRVLRALKRLGATDAATLVEKLLSVDDAIRQEALETARFLRRKVQKQS
jgi:hypothetical protein